MVHSEIIAINIAKALLGIGAIKLRPENPFTWASGWKSPIYCDNRKTLSYLMERDLIKYFMRDIIRGKYKDVEAIAGVATGAIGIAAIVADMMQLPFVYVRSEPKGHGLGNVIEGEVHPGQEFVVIEDLISTGGSSIKAVNALRAAGCKVLGMVAIFTYDFPKAIDAFREVNCELTTLTSYEALLPVAIEQGLITEKHMTTLNQWSANPGEWRNDLKEAVHHGVMYSIIDEKGYYKTLRLFAGGFFYFC